MEKKTDPCEDTKYIIFATPPTKPPREEVDQAVGHLKKCEGCRSEISAEDRAKFVSGVARGREENLGGNLEAALGPGSKAVEKRVPAPYPMPKPHRDDELEAS